MDRRTIRYGAAAIATAIAAIYLLIGIGILDVVADRPGAVSTFTFGTTAGAAFLLGALLLAAFDERRLWIMGAAFQAIVVLGYLGVAPERDPPFEAWGLSLRILQVPLLAALLYLSLPAAPRLRRGRGEPPGQPAA